MRSMQRATVIALVLTAIAGAAGAQQAPIKIAYVNTQSLMEAAPGRPQVEEVLGKEGDGYKAQVDKMQDSINALLTKYQKDEPTLSATAKESRQKTIQGLETEFQAMQMRFQTAFQQHQTEAMAPILDVVRKVLDDIRVEGGYSIIFSNDPQTTPIVSADKNLDITDKVVSRLKATPAPAAIKAADPNAAPKKPAGAPPAPAGVTRKPPPQQ